MRIDSFDFELPTGRIAQRPTDRRDGSRLMVVDRKTGRFHHCRFAQLPSLLEPDDLVVLNNTRVFPARLFVPRPNGRPIEILLARQLEPALWEVLARPAKKVRPGDRLIFRAGELEARVEDSADPARRRIRFECQGDLREAIWRVGSMPLPPYIERSRAADAENDRERYQTVFAEVEGSIAAPTAGLHFTPEMLRTLHHVLITLHVGYGTFQPIRSQDVRRHQMEPEWFQVDVGSAATIREQLEAGRRVVAVGSTSTRVLEHLMIEKNRIEAGAGRTDLFIYPGFEFKAVGALVTNFHLPRSTLLLLVSAFAGVELIREAYREAVKEGYRFYSYGDAMLIL